MSYKGGIMKTTFLLILSLSLFPAKAEKLSYTELVNRLPEILERGDSPEMLEQFSRLHFLNEKYSLFISPFKIIPTSIDLRRAQNQIYEQTFNGRDNIFHLLIHSERAFEKHHRSSLNREGTEEVNSETLQNAVRQDLDKAIDFIYLILGPQRFLKLLDKPNQEDISPALLATRFKGEAHKALVKFIQKDRALLMHTYEWPIVFSILGIASLVTFPDPGNLIGMGLSTAGAGLCYMSFKQNKDLKKISRDLDQTNF